MTYVDSFIAEKFEDFAAKLPHGSGIDMNWSVWESDNYVYFTNSYHLVHPDTAMGWEWQDFTLRLPRKAYDYATMARDFKVQFNGGECYMARRTFLRDYLEDTFAHHLQSLA